MRVCVLVVAAGQGGGGCLKRVAKVCTYVRTYARRVAFRGAGKGDVPP